MQKISMACAVLLFVAFVASLAFLARHFLRAESLDYTAVGELHLWLRSALKVS